MVSNRSIAGIELLPPKYNGLLFSATAVVGAALGLYFGGFDLVLLWGLPIGALIGSNIGYNFRQETAPETTVDERDQEILDSAMAWGFLTIVAGFMLGMTYTILSSMSIETIFVGSILAGVTVTTLVMGVSEIQHRNLI
ncbi:hypothetical protein [Haladaptatus sp. R4]|uniref:hypothetical protein n=1 Tax=Haladaptatus sp. R4 TaxID=1679489 RepID=UPI000AFA938B|nr:hypothetical protein [Haladaptatus sp. R4]